MRKIISKENPRTIKNLEFAVHTTKFQKLSMILLIYKRFLSDLKIIVVITVINKRNGYSNIIFYLILSGRNHNT